MGKGVSLYLHIENQCKLSLKYEGEIKIFKFSEGYHTNIFFEININQKKK